MPSYDYFCPTNNQTIEVSHRMNETVQTWGELCNKAEIDPGSTPSDSPVEKRFTCCQVSTNAAPELPCGSGQCPYT